MVHLAPDSRLLVSLVKQEQVYAAQLHNLLNASGTSLSALAVYASSSPPTVSPVLNGVAGALSGADEALRAYGESLNDWINQLGRIKQKEEEVTTIGRDREILVTRLLKVSQKSKSPPPSLLHSAPDPSSSTSFSTFNSKINTAQSELQACESRLADKERELEKIRTHVIRQGLKRRCNALIQCGRVWSDMGGRAVEMLGTLDGAHSPINGHATEFFKPLPDPTHDHDRDSVLSSLSPSQSASQIGAMSPLSVPLVADKPYRLDLPPPHLVSDASVMPQTSGPEGSSSSDEEGPVEVHENPRFNPAPILNRAKKNTNTWTAPSSARHSPVPFPATNSDLGPSNKLGPREKKRMGLFGNIAALFRTSMSPKSGAQQDSTWNTRTNHNIRTSKTDGEQSSDEEDVQPRSGRLRKGKSRPPAASLDDRRATQVNDIQGGAQTSPSDTPRRKRSGKLGRNSTVRSTVSEPAGTPRLRATTLSTESPMPTIPNGTARRHGRTASMDGRWGLADTGVDTASLSTTWKPGKSKGESLMRIVEGPASDDPSSRLEVVRAPGSSVPRLPLLVNPPPPLVSTSVPSSPVQPKVVANKRASMPVPTTTAPGLLVAPKPVAAAASDKKPLRSAMRRPSPSPSPTARPASEYDQSPVMAPLSLPAPTSLSPNPRPGPLPRREVPSTIIESPRQSIVDTTAAEAHRQSYASAKTDDTASISSYETGHETLGDEEGTETEQAHVLQSTAPDPPPPPPPVSEKPAVPSPQHPEFHATDQHELSSATSTDTAAPSRRKSVRMSSLPPQVSATPPALDEYNDADHSPWNKSPPQQKPRPRSDVGSGWNTRIPTHDAALTWEDSSSEDETYKAARNALSRADRRSEKKKGQR